MSQKTTRGNICLCASFIRLMTVFPFIVLLLWFEQMHACTIRWLYACQFSAAYLPPSSRSGFFLVFWKQVHIMFTQMAIRRLNFPNPWMTQTSWSKGWWWWVTPASPAASSAAAGRSSPAGWRPRWCSWRGSAGWPCSSSSRPAAPTDAWSPGWSGCNLPFARWSCGNMSPALVFAGPRAEPGADRLAPFQRLKRAAAPRRSLRRVRAVCLFVLRGCLS